ncbi:hypothetical protein MYSI104531_27140 [Mycobacterium simiae]
MLLRFGKPVQAVCQRRFRLRRGQRVVDAAAGRCIEQIAEHRRNDGGVRPQRRQVDPGGGDNRLIGNQGGVEQFHRLV